MRLQLSLLGCRLLIATGADTEPDDAPAVVTHTEGDFTIAAPLEPDVTPEDHYGFRSTQ